MASAHVQECADDPVRRVFACDDLLGKLYCCLDSPKDRQALRHSTSACYRSPAVNSHIVSCDILGLTGAAAKLAAFPKPAQMRTLVIDASGPPSTILPHLLSPEGAAARARIQNVHNLVCKGGRLDAIWASMLPLLLPCLKDPQSQPGGGCCSLSLIHSTITKDAFSTLAAQLRGVTALQLTNTALKDWDALNALAKFLSLTHLEMRYSDPEEGGIFSVAPLRALSGLSSLVLRGLGMCADGLEECMKRLPLRHLCLEDVFFPAPPPRLQSSSLRCLEVHLNASYPQLCPQELPHVEVLQLRGLSMHHESLGTMEDQLELLQPIVASLAGFSSKVEVPVVTPEQAFLRPVSVLKEFLLSFEPGKGSYPPSEVVPPLRAVLQLLVPLGPALSSAERVYVGGMVADQEALRMLGRLFPSSQETILFFVRLADCTWSEAREILPRLRSF